MHPHGISVAWNLDLSHWVAVPPAHFFRVLKEQAQRVQIVAEGHILHGVGLNAMGFVLLDLAGADRHDGHVSEESNQGGEAHAYSLSGVWLLPVFYVLAPRNELTGRRGEVFASFREAT